MPAKNNTNQVEWLRHFGAGPQIDALQRQYDRDAKVSVEEKQGERGGPANALDGVDPEALTQEKVKAREAEKARAKKREAEREANLNRERTLIRQRKGQGGLSEDPEAWRNMEKGELARRLRAGRRFPVWPGL